MKYFLKLKAFYEKWLVFVRQNYFHVLFISLFYSFVICITYFRTGDLSLERFSGRMIGEATLKGIDVGQRVSHYYNSLFIFLGSNLLFFLITFFLFQKKQTSLTKAKILNLISLIGCLLILLNVFNLNTHISLYLILSLQVTALTYLIYQKILLTGLNKKIFNPTFFSISVCMCIFFFFMVKELFLAMQFKWEIELPFFLPCFCAFYFPIIGFSIKNLDYNSAQSLVTKRTLILLPLALTPLLSSLKDEVYMILNNKAIYSLTPINLYFILLFALTLWIYWRSRKWSKLKPLMSNFKLLSNYYFPLLVIGIVTYFSYSPFFVNSSTEMFERGNRFLPVMEFFKFHTIPIVEKFNSHALSDFFSIYLYALFNNLRGMEPLIYDFIFPVTTALIVYFIIKDLTRNPYVAVFTVLLFPFADHLIPNYFAPALLSVYALHRFLYKTPSLKNYLLLFGTITFLMLWRIDLGIASAVSTILLLLIYRLASQFRFQKRLMLISAGWFFLASFLISLLLALKGVNILSNFHDFLAHLSSTQSYGFSTLTNKMETKELSVFLMQYYFFPVFCLFISGFVFLRFKKLTNSTRSKFATLCLLFCIGFYFGNFQRGLVRHSFIEQTDLNLSSFIFLIISGSSYLIYTQRSHISKFLTFFFLSYFLITGFKYPETHPQVAYELFQDKLNKFPQIKPQNSIKRELNPDFITKGYLEFKNFVAKQLKPDETFIDFTNAPMLYYFTNKVTPSLFYQNPICIHNDYLQKRFLEDLTKYKTPLLVFARSPHPDSDWGWDYMDFVPNSLRHYKMAEYFFQNYKPFTIVQNYCLWKNLNSNMQNPINHTFSLIPDSFQHPFQYDTFQNKIIDSLCTTEKGNIIITITGKNNSAPDCSLFFRKGKDSTLQKLEVFFSDPHAHKTYFTLTHGIREKFRFLVNHPGAASQIEINDLKYIPDFYSTRFQKWDIALLPYIWATFDKDLKSAQVLKIISTPNCTLNKQELRFNLPASIDKSTGNYISILLEAHNIAPVLLKLTYGPSNGEINFILPPGNGLRTLAIRISSQYNWYAKNNTELGLSAESSETIYLKKLTLLKGD